MADAVATGRKRESSSLLSSQCRCDVQTKESSSTMASQRKRRAWKAAEALTCRSAARKRYCAESVVARCGSQKVELDPGGQQFRAGGTACTCTSGTRLLAPASSPSAPCSSEKKTHGSLRGCEHQVLWACNERCLYQFEPMIMKRISPAASVVAFVRRLMAWLGKRRLVWCGAHR